LAKNAPDAENEIRVGTGCQRSAGSAHRRRRKTFSLMDVFILTAGDLLRIRFQKAAISLYLFINRLRVTNLGTQLFNFLLGVIVSTQNFGILPYKILCLCQILVVKMQSKENLD
jgi:hypothetical protein